MDDLSPPWPAPPLVSGPWRDLDEALGEDLRRLLLGEESRDRSLAEAGKLLRFRARPLPFWPDFLWLDALVETADGSRAVAAILYGPLGPLPITGESALAHEMNARGLLDLGTSEQAADYLRFFCSAVRGDEGPFYLIESPDRFAELSGAAMPRECLAHAVPIGIEAEGEGWEAGALVYYGSALFRSRFAISADGMIEMIDDRLISESQPEPLPVLDGFLCRIRPNGGSQ